MEVLKREAERLGISPNALLNKVLREYCQYAFMPFPVILISQETFAQIIASCSKEEVKAIARNAGSRVLRDVFNSAGLDLDYENIIGYIKDGLGQYSNWFTYSHHINKQAETFHLRHHLGENWSLYVSEAISTMLQTYLHVKPRVETLGNTITIKIPINAHV